MDGCSRIDGKRGGKKREEEKKHIENVLIIVFRERTAVEFFFHSFFFVISAFCPWRVSRDGGYCGNGRNKKKKLEISLRSKAACRSVIRSRVCRVRSHVMSGYANFMMMER